MKTNYAKRYARQTETLAARNARLAAQDIRRTETPATRDAALAHLAERLAAREARNASRRTETPATRNARLAAGRQIRDRLRARKRC